ncbi:conserved exported hypothetical protein [Vibrio nigripulchritudo FTn2]|uniref:hypothetical protein n=1 Tax=Vibrio nigripulchritudo TaxID=28173 RepID=UPI0003B1F909|nr:hypothetical protein [Vibrio nigripulchritudo]CCN39722.1 conserved exported hypothetical protein [Vibrio nigripulchritudo FTn2]
MKMKLIRLAIVASLFISSSAKPSGFPVLDVSNLVQSVTQYSLLLKEYEQLLAQTGLDTNQLFTIINQYEQTLREYSVLLNQVSSLQDKLERRDIPGLHRDATRLYEEYHGSNESQVNSQVARRVGAFESRAEIERLSSSTIGSVPNHLDQDFVIVGDIHTKARQQEHYLAENNRLRADIDKVDSQRLSLGDQSELQTLQLIVEQNQILMEQIANQNEILLSNLTYSNRSTERAEQAALKAKVRQLQVVEKALQDGISVDERPLR